MRLSTKGRYGLMAMFELAQKYGDGPMSLRRIAEKQKLSNSYLEQLFSVLKKDGLIESVRGAQGGYLLADNPNNITVGHVLRSLEGDLSPSECTGENHVECVKEDNCATKLVLIKLKDSIDEVVDSITLEDMILDMRKINLSK